MRLATASILASVALLQACTVKDYTLLDIRAIAVSPANPAIPIGSTQQFTATGTLADGSSMDISGAVSWSSSDTSVATIDGSGTANALAAGTTTITARSGTVTGSTAMTVRSLAGLASIVISPANPPSLPIGEAQQFQATGMFSDGSTVDLTRSATWSSSDSTVASIDTFGLARGLRAGATTIQASSAGINGTTQLRVVSLASIAVTPMTPTIAIGGTQQFTAIGTFSDQSTRDLGASVSWSSSAEAVATITASGLATGRTAGTSRIRATSRNQSTVSGETVLTVLGLISIAISPSDSQLRLGDSRPFTALGTFSDGSVVDITTSVTWSSTVETVATITSGPPTPGVVTARAAGTTTIRAVSGTVPGTTALTVLAPTSIAVLPSNASIRLGDSQQFTARGTFSDSSMLDISQFVTWSATPQSVATITSTGIATGQSAGTATIRATSGGTPSTFGETTLMVRAPTSISVTPNYPSIATGGTQPFAATGTFSDSSTRDLTQFVDWTSSDTGVATINPSGVAFGLTPGGTTIRASSRGTGSVSGTTGLTVGVVSIAITPLTATIPRLGTQQFTATGTFTSGPQQNITNFVAWSSSMPAVASINASGVATGLTAGVTMIGARSGLITQAAPATLTVTP